MHDWSLPRRPGSQDATVEVLLMAALCALGAWLLAVGDPHQGAFLQINRLGAWWPQGWASLSVLGLGLSAFIVLALVAPGRQRPPLQVLAALVCAFPTGGAMTHLLKRLMNAPRPAAVLAEDSHVRIGDALLTGSMPSGHAVTAATVLGLVWLGHRLGRAQRLGLVGVVVLVMLSRVTTAAHWPVDVLVGAALGGLNAVLAWSLTRSGGLVRWLEGRSGQALLAVTQIGTGVVMVTLRTGYPQAEPFQWLLGGAGVAAGVWRLRGLSRRSGPATTTGSVTKSAQTWAQGLGR